MAMPHRDNVAGRVPLRPDHHHQASIEMTRSDEARLAIVAPVINDRRRSAGENLGGPCEIQSTMLECAITLRRVEADLQLIVPPINVKHSQQPKPVRRTKSGARIVARPGFRDVQSWKLPTSP
jgi:hypothetical protein